MEKVLNFKNKLSYFLNLIDKRQQEGDLWGVLDATRNAITYSKTKIEREGLDLLIGQVYYDMGQYSLSCEYFFRAVNIPHLRSACFFGLARNLICVKKYDLALDYLEGTLKWDFSNTWTGAVLEWTRVIKNNMDNPNFENENLLKSAKNLISQQEWAKAKEILQTLKSDDETQGCLALCYLLEEDYSTSERLIKEVLLNNPENVMANCIMIEISQHRENEILMTKHLQRLYLNETKNPEDILRIAMLFSSRKEWVKALIFFERLIKVDEFNSKNHLLCALCCHNLNKYEDALYHISRARWLDIENPLYLFFFQLLKTHDLPDEVVIRNRLPKEIEKQKIESLLEIFYSGKFAQEINKSYYLLQDIEWSFSLYNTQLTQEASSALCNCKHKNSVALIKKLLLSPRPNTHQKFVMAKNALLSNNFWTIDFVCNLRYSSFQISKNELTQIKNVQIRNGICGAISYVECFFPEEMKVTELSKHAYKEQNNPLLNNMSADTISCFLLYKYPHIFVSACLFFDIQKEKIEQLYKTVSRTNEAESENSKSINESASEHHKTNEAEKNDKQ